MSNPQPIFISYEDLTSNSKDIIDSIKLAFGSDGLGLIIVKGVPGYSEARANCLPLGYKFGNLSEEIKSKYEDRESIYSFGWSCGKEKMSSGLPDVSKGSYYANPTYDIPSDNPEDVKLFPAFFRPNIWPDNDCSGFSQSFKTLGQLLVDTGALLSKSIDALVDSQQSNYAIKLSNVISTSRNAKARLLYYFPSSSSSSEKKSEEWCGWHFDHGSLTGLASAMYFDSNGKEVSCPDDKAGLYVRIRSGETVQVKIPSDCIAFQIGETAQIHSGGLLQATAHMVRAAESPGISRSTLAVFMEPGPFELMNCPEGSDIETVVNGGAQLLPKGVPLLSTRWNAKSSQTFGDFTEKTLSSYY